jgi:hypothetical protein
MVGLEKSMRSATRGPRLRVSVMASGPAQIPEHTSPPELREPVPSRCLTAFPLEMTGPACAAGDARRRQSGVVVGPVGLCRPVHLSIAGSCEGLGREGTRRDGGPA